MSKPIANPRRLSRLPESEDSLGVGRMFRNGRELPEEEFSTLRWRLRTSQRLRAMRPRLFLRVALVVGMAFCLGGVVGAVAVPFWTRKEPVGVVSPARAPTQAPTPRRGKTRPAPAAPAEPALSEPISEATEADTTPAPAPAVTNARPLPDEPKPVPAPAKHRTAVHVAILNQPVPPSTPSDVPALAPPPVAPSPIAVEQALLGQSLRMLRDGHDAQTALTLLAQHAERFPKGALASEASMLRIEALLALGRRDEALAVLDHASLASMPNRDEQLVVRGELRAAKGRWRDSKQDFDDMLRDGPLPAASTKARNIQERALWGRASVRSRLGDQDGARANLGMYLRHFPGGQFAGRAASLLKGMP